MPEEHPLFVPCHVCHKPTGHIYNERMNVVLVLCSNDCRRVYQVEQKLAARGRDDSESKDPSSSNS